MSVDPQWLSYARRHGDEFGEAMAEEIENQELEIEASADLLDKVIAYLEPRVGHIPQSQGFALLNELKEFLK